MYSKCSMPQNDVPTHIHARAQAYIHMHTHARTHARTHTQKHTIGGPKHRRKGDCLDIIFLSRLVCYYNDNTDFISQKKLAELSLIHCFSLRLKKNPHHFNACLLMNMLFTPVLVIHLR